MIQISPRVAGMVRSWLTSSASGSRYVVKALIA